MQRRRWPFLRSLVTAAIIFAAATALGGVYTSGMTTFAGGTVPGATTFSSLVTFSSGIVVNGAVQLGGASTTLIDFRNSNATVFTIQANALIPAADATQAIASNTSRLNVINVLTVRSGSTAAVDTAGTGLSIVSQTGGAALSGNAGVGGAINATASTGGASNGTGNAAAGGAANWRSGIGGAGSGAIPGASSGTVLIASNTGGAGTATAAAGNSGSITIQTNSPGAANGGVGGNSGDIIFNISAATGSGSQGAMRFQSAGSNVIGFSPASSGFTSSTAGAAVIGTASNYFGTIQSRHFAGGGSAPAIAVSAATQLGTTPAAAFVSGSTDAGGTVTITTGTAPAAFAANIAVTVATITFSSTYAATPRSLVCSPAGFTSAAIATGTNGVVFFAEQSSVSTSQYLLRAISSTTPTLAASTTYSIACSLMQ